MSKRSDQEDFWAGDFGTNYIGRNDDRGLIAGNTRLFAEALKGININSALEIGANIGQNLSAIRNLYPETTFSAIEINETACRELSKRHPECTVWNDSITEAEGIPAHELVLSKGVLIHLKPELLREVYERMLAWSTRFILIAEYYNPTPVSIPYRGHDERLFKRDFAGDLMAVDPSLSLVRYGFCYRNDPVHPMDDITWFLLEKSS